MSHVPTTVVHCMRDPYDVYIGRPNPKVYGVPGADGRYGNPFTHLSTSSAKFRVDNRVEAVVSYRDWLKGPENRELYHEMRRKLTGRRLGCWCHPLACHGDAIADLLQVRQVYAGVGSRQTPVSILEDMRKLGRFLAQEGWRLRSGGAGGADQAFEEGARSDSGDLEIILPYDGFQSRKADGSSYLLLAPHLVPRAELLLRRARGDAWTDSRRDIALRYHLRNTCQVFGTELDQAVDLLVCWFETMSSGTGTAWALAELAGVPRFNLFKNEDRGSLRTWLTETFQGRCPDLACFAQEAHA